MTKPQITIFNLETGEETTRLMTDEEFVQHNIDNEKVNTELAEAEAKAVARQAVLDRLGLTEEEAQLILGGSN
jgi:hypothetical protein